MPGPYSSLMVLRRRASRSGAGRAVRGTKSGDNSRVPRLHPPPWRLVFFVPNQRDLGGASAPLGGASCAPGAARRRGPLADGPSRGARPVGVALTRRARPPASFPAGPRTVPRECRHSKQLPSFFPLFERRCCTPSPPVILDAPDLPRRELDRDPDDRPQVADEAPLIAAFARLLHRGLLRLSLVA